jgi:hypothetical protein
MVNHANEHEMKVKISEAFRNRFLDTQKREVFSPNIRDEDFQNVKIQLRALGYIAKASERGGHAAWTLTPYGDTVLTQIAAIRSNKTKYELGLPGTP